MSGSALARLVEFASTAERTGRDSALDPFVRFMRRTAELLRSGTRTEPGHYAVFQLSVGHPQTGSLWNREFSISSHTDLLDKVWHVNEVVRNGYHAPLLPDGGRGLNDALEALIELGLGDLATVVYDSRAVGEELRLYPEGLNSESSDAVGLSPSDASAGAVARGMDSLFKKMLSRPGLSTGAGAVWSDAARGIPTSHAEAVLQNHVMSGLAFHFHQCDVYQEVNVEAGRLDICVEEFSTVLQATTVHAVIELKVLKSRGAGGSVVAASTNRAAVKKGVLQAFAYRLNKHASWSSLYCFDLRDSDEGDEQTFAHVVEDSARWDVELRRWYLPRTADEARGAY